MKLEGQKHEIEEDTENFITSDRTPQHGSRNMTLLIYSSIDCSHMWK